MYVFVYSILAIVKDISSRNVYFWHCSPPDTEAHKNPGGQLFLRLPVCLRPSVTLYSDIT